MKMRSQPARSRVPGVVPFLLCISAGTAAQSEEQPVENVVVYGQALSVERAIEAKRQSNHILDAVAQDDMGRLPDLNTAQAVMRVPGVAVQNDQGEARFPIVRGLNATYNRTTIDGMFVASPERGSLGRAVPLDLIPAFLLSQIEVQKSVTADVDHNAIGGTINLVTRSAFQYDEPFFLGGLFLGSFEQSGSGTTLDEGDEVTPWRGNLAAGTTFGDQDQFGVVVGLDYSIRNFEIPQVEVDDADYTEFDDDGNNVGLGNGNGYVVPTNQRIFFYNNVRERIGATARLEWQASEDLYLDIAGYYNEYNDSERRDEQTYELGTSGSSSQPSVIRSQTATSGVTDTGYNFVGIGRFTLDRDIMSVRTGLEWDVAPDVSVDFDIGLTSAELYNPEITEAFSTGNDLGARYDTSQFFNTVTPLDPDEFYNLQNYAHINRGVLDRFSDEDSTEAHLDVDWFEAFGDSVSLKAGLLYRDVDKSEGFTFNRYVVDPSLVYTLAAVPDDELADVTWQGGYRMDNRIDLEASDRFFDSNTFNNVLTSSSGSVANETVTALYLMAEYEGDRLGVVGGVRFENTDWDGAPQGGEVIEGSYDDVLPSINIRYDLTDDLKLRGAISQTLGRPNLSDLTRGENINLADNTISRSNPDLKPRRANNFDLSLEWYIPNGLLAAGVFYKDIEDEIFTLTTPGPVVVDGVTYDALTQPENATDASIFGVEAQYQQSLGFLPKPFDGFGLLVNATVLDTEYVVPLSDGTTRETSFYQQPEFIANTTLFYATPFFEVRASYNYTDMFIDTIVPNNPNLDEYWEARSQVDMQVRLNLTDHMTLIGEGQNLTDAGRREVTGPGEQYLQEDAMFGRTFWLGLTWTAE